MSEKEAQKASAIIQQLYEARCNGNWHAVPDLVRRVEKYAPSRKCLALASRASASILAQPSPSAFQKTEELYGAQLAEAVKDGTSSSEEVLDGVTCRALIMFGMGDAQATLGALPASITKPAPPTKGIGHEAWTATCVVITFLVRGLALEKSGRHEEAASNYRPVISYLSSLVQLPSLAPELRRWTEELLCHVCLFYSTETSEKPAQFGQAMAVFHILSRLLDTQNGALSTKLGSITHDTARQVWKAYYLAFTRVINQGLVYHPSPIERDHEVPEHRGLLEDDEYFASRVQQCKDLMKVESSYEIQLMIDIKFPKAGESNVDIKEFVENVMLNWRALCGPSWSEKEIGERGKSGVAKRVVEILYRAATKTFHSPQILRHLFTVHAYLSEFDLAFKSLDAYLGIMTKGKARVKKSGDAALDLDDDDQFIAFLAEGIRVACRYGAAQSAEKALGLGATLAHWLRTGSTSSMADHGADKHLQRSFQPSTENRFNPETTALAYGAIGLSLANWSRSTFEPASRASAQELATINLEHALKQDLSDSQCTETLYCLAVILAETRQIPEAMALVRRALRSDDEAAAVAQPVGVSSPRKSSVSSRPGTSSRPNTSPRAKRENAFTKTRKMLPVWHLLAQLLSACEEFDGAASACRMAFSSLVELFSPTSQSNGLALGQTPSPPPSGPGLSDAAIEALDHYEKQTLIEIQMTSVTLIGISEGPSAAVNASDDLLALYARLYGPVKDSSPHPVQPHRDAGGARPKSSHGSIRSIFTRNKHKSQVQHSRKTGDGLASIDKTQGSTRPSTATVAPSVQVTNHDAEDNDASVLSEKHHNGEQTKSALKKTASLRSRKSKEPVSSDAAEKLDVAQQISEATPTMPEIPHNIKHDKMPPPPGHAQQPPQQDTRLPTPLPSEDDSPIATHFDQAQELRQKRSLLVKIWLFIAHLYREAEQYDDGQDALEEAMRVVEQLELAVASKDASVKKLRERGWGNGASVDELWADAYAERGDLLKVCQRVHDATTAYEAALSHNSDHPHAIVGLADILMEKYSKHVTLDRRQEAIQLAGNGMPSPPGGARAPHARVEALERKSPAELDTPALYRLAARDRAYALLAALTKLGSGWDDAEAWLAYARALEESGQPERAKGALWWTVELEDTAPARHWRHASPGGYVL